MGTSPKPSPRPVALVPGPFEERGALARARARRNRQERRAGSLLGSIGSSISDGLRISPPGNKTLSNSPSRARIGDYGGQPPAPPQVELNSDRMRYANGGSTSRSPPYRARHGHNEDEDPDEVRQSSLGPGKSDPITLLAAQGPERATYPITVLTA